MRATSRFDANCESDMISLKKLTNCNRKLDEKFSNTHCRNGCRK